MQFWNELEGQTIDGLYPLRRLVRSEGRRAWFETETGGGPATISLIEALTDADEVVARLQAAENLQHPNLVSIAKVGQVRIDNTLVVYAVMEHIEQSLSDVLQSQALSAEEGREVAEALVSALTAIHQKGMSHGHVEAASVLATEQAVKLRSDCLHISTTGQAEDVAGIGATLFHAFTQRKALTATDAQINRIPAPFAEIVRNSFARRWNLAQIANALKPGLPSTATVPPLPPVPPPAQAPLQFEPTAETVPEKAPPVAYRRAAPSIPVAKSVPVVTEEDATGQKSTPTRPLRALYVAAAVCVLAIVGWLLLRPHSTTPETASSAQPVTQAPEPTPPIAMKPLAVKPAPPPHQPRPVTSAPVATPSSGRTVWRVVVYTYKGQTKAADALAKISGKYPDLDASVFNPRGSDVYMVVLGGAMDRSHAISMLDKARSKGVPPDTYIRNFSE